MMEQIHVAVADDEQLQIENMLQMLKEVSEDLSLDLKIDTYTSGEAFLFALEDHPEWQLAFLDIEMAKLNGMEVARKVREKNSTLEVVFVTAYAEYALEGYEVAALDYLLKPVTTKEIKHVFERFLARKPKTEPEILIKVTGEWVRYRLADILYAESQGRFLEIHLTSGECHSHSYRLRDFSEAAGRSFIQPHRSYCVNLEYVQQILKTGLLLANGEHIPISRRLMKDVQAAFIDYYKKRAFYHE